MWHARVAAQLTLQPWIAAVPAVTRTSAWKPPFHCAMTAYEAEHESPGGALVTGGDADVVPPVGEAVLFAAGQPLFRTKRSRIACRRHTR